METEMGKLDALPHISLYPGSAQRRRWQSCDSSARGLTISPFRGLHSAISMEEVDGGVAAVLRPRTGSNDQIFIPLRVQKHTILYANIAKGGR